MTVCSSVASLFVNGTLIYDVVRTKDFRRSGSGLTAKQRQLVIVVMILLTYIAFGALMFNLLIPGMNFQNALYFTVSRLHKLWPIELQTHSYHKLVLIGRISRVSCASGIRLSHLS